MKKSIFIIAAFILLFSSCGGENGGNNGGNPGTADWPWTTLLGVSGSETKGNAVFTDSAGNCYVTGYTKGNLGGKTLTGSSDAFVIKYDPSGKRLWINLLGVSGKETKGFGISVDPGGNIYITGHTMGNLDGETIPGDYSGFVTKYDSSGEKKWTRLFGPAGSTAYAYGISVDSAGNSYIAGQTFDEMDLQTTTGVVDSFVIKYDTLGEKKWTKLFGGGSSSHTYGQGITLDADMNVYVTGQTDDNLGGVAKTGSIDCFIIKFDSTGDKKWTKLLGVTAKTTTGNSISVDSDKNCYITGTTYGNLDGEVLTGSADLFVVKYDTAGDKKWTRLLGGNDYDTTGKSISSDPDGNSYVTGYTRANIDGLLKTGFYDAFVVKYNGSGDKQSTKHLGVSGRATYGSGISLDSDGNCYVTGYTMGNLDGQTLTGSQDLYLTTRMN